MIKHTIMLLTLVCATQAQADCDLAAALVIRANELFNHQAPIDETIAILTQATETCPSNPEAHNNLANLLGEQKQYAAAEAHYRQALALKPDFSLSWYGLGELYEAWAKPPQALEAYLHACIHKDMDAKARADALLKTQSVAEVPDDAVLEDQQNLAMLLDPASRKKTNDLARLCGLRAVMQSKLILRNLEFNLGQATLANTAANKRQIRAISTALNRLPETHQIQVAGHSDNTPFSNVSPEESDRLNLELSQQRAETIRNTFAAYGVAVERITAQGYGNSKPISTENQSRNRRVEITVD